MGTPAEGGSVVALAAAVGAERLPDASTASTR
jgi:hypothetical protein